MKIDKLSRESYVEQTLEILAALRKLGDTLRPDEESFLASHATDSLRLFEKVDQEQLGESCHHLTSVVIKQVTWPAKILFMQPFYPHHAMLARVFTYLSVCPSRAGIVSKRRKLAS